MARSLMCLYFSMNSYNNISYLWEDKCLLNNSFENKLIKYHNEFMGYFVFDTLLLLYQNYLKIEENIRLDLLLHHILAITALIFIENDKFYGISLLIGLSEGMSVVSGLKLLLQDKYGEIYRKSVKNLVKFRLGYIGIVRMLYLWPSIVYYYWNVTDECDRYKNKRNMFLIIGMIILIIHAEIKWIHSGRKELARI